MNEPMGDDAVQLLASACADAVIAACNMRDGPSMSECEIERDEMHKIMARYLDGEPSWNDGRKLLAAVLRQALEIVESDQSA